MTHLSNGLLFANTAKIAFAEQQVDAGITFCVTRPNPITQKKPNLESTENTCYKIVLVAGLDRVRKHTQLVSELTELLKKNHDIKSHVI